MASFFRRKRDQSPREQGPLSRRPPNTAFRQQRLKSWQPLLTPQSVLPLLILIACAFTPIGIALIANNNGIQDLIIDYSRCDEEATNEFQEIPGKYTGYHFSSSVETKPSWRLIKNDADDGDGGVSTCQLQFEIPNDINKHIYIYYKLTNFYQNHRRYVSSYDFKQLRGKPLTIDQLSSDCKPLRSRDDKVIYPCGLIANSMFNDTFSQALESVDPDTVESYSLTNKGISWPIDGHIYKKTEYNVSDIVPPPNWMKRFPDGYTEDNLPDLHSWEEFHVWMRTAPFSKFYKLALKNETHSLLKGTYTIDIELNYPVSVFGGTKSFVLTTEGITGTKNLSVSIAFLIVAGLCALLAAGFLFKLILQPRALGDQSYLNFEANDADVESQQQILEMMTPLREIL